VKEAVHNVIKHANGSEVLMNVTWNNSRLDITIQDDGCGFDPQNGPAGNGLTNMRQRMRNIGGNCSIESRPGAGTTVHLHMVIKQDST
jgi:signal transduction histidine kinase